MSLTCEYSLQTLREIFLQIFCLLIGRPKTSMYIILCEIVLFIEEGRVDILLDIRRYKPISLQLPPTTKSLRKAPGLVAWMMKMLRGKMGMKTYKDKDDDNQDYEDDEEQHW